MLELAACIRGCDLKHSSCCGCRTPPNLLPGTASPLKVPTIRSRAAAAFPTTTSPQKDSHLVDWQAQSKSIALRVLIVRNSGCRVCVPFSQPVERVRAPGDRQIEALGGGPLPLRMVTVRLTSRDHRQSSSHTLTDCAGVRPSANSQAQPKTPSSEKDWARQLETPQHKAGLLSAVRPGWHRI